MLAHAVRWSLSERIRDAVALTKPRLSFLVLLTTAGGMWLAPGALAPTSFFGVLLATACVVGAANALNCWLERDVDARMRRTSQRPLPAGRIDGAFAWQFGMILGCVAVPALAWFGNLLTAALGLFSWVLYVAVYTPLKQRTAWALVVGAVPGAMPALMGWTAVTGSVDPGGLALFALLFAWQLPHFLAISIYLKEDYKRGGLKVFAAVYGEPRAKAAIVGSLLLLVPVSLSLVPLGVAGPVYGALAAVAGVAFAALCFNGIRRMATNRWARRVFLGSLGYLTTLYAALILA